jgi:hypothetical protein
VLSKTRTKKEGFRTRPRVSITVAPKVMDAVEAKAKREECSLSEMISRLLRDSLLRLGDMPTSERCEAR